MLSAWCAQHGARVLVTPSQIRAIDVVEHAIVVRYRCACGAVGTERIPRRRRARRGVQVATP